MNGQSLRILMIGSTKSDYVDVRTALSEIESLNITPDWVEGYDAALSAIDSQQHNVYIIGYRLGDRNGLDFVRQAVEQGCAAPLILLTGQEDENIGVEAIRAGAADSLIKGHINAFVLERSIIYALERSQKLATLRESEQKLRKQAAELDVVTQVDAAISTILNSRDLLQYVVDLTKDGFGLSCVYIGLLNETGDTIEMVTGAGEVGRQIINTNPSIAVGQEKSLVARAVRSRQSVVVNNVHEEPDYYAHPLIVDTQSELVVPIIVGERILGVLDVQSSRLGYFDAGDIRVYSNLATQVGVALESVRRFEKERQLAAELEDARNFLDSVIENIPDSIFIKEAEKLRFVRWNKANEIFIGVNREDAIGKTDYDIFPKEVADLYVTSDREVLADGKQVDIPEQQISAANGETRIIHTRKIPILDTGGKPKYLLGISQDITERKQIEKALQQAHDELEQRVAQRTAELQKANEQLITLYQIGQTITAPLQLDVVLDVIALNTAKILGTDTGVILLLDEDAQTLTIEGTYGLSETIVQNTRDKVGQSIAGRVVQTGQPIIANDLPNDARFYNPSAADEGLLACASVPLEVGRKIIGTLDVHSKVERNAFGEEHVQMLKMLASQAAIAIDNARLYKELQAANDELEMRVERRTAELVAVNEQLHQEIAERTRAEEQLVAERNLLHTLIDALPDNICVKDKKGRFVHANMAVARIMGADSPDQIVGRTDFDFYPQETAAEFYTEEQTIIKSGQALINKNEPAMDLTGDKRWILTTKVPWQDDEGNIVGIVGVGRDITELKRTEEALRESEERYRATFDQAPVGIAQIDTGKRWLWANKKLCDILGYSQKELQGITSDDITFIEDVNPKSAHVRQMELGNLSAYSREKRYVKKDGSIVWVNQTVSIVRDQLGEPQYYVEVVEDINQRKALELRLDQLLDQRFRQVQTSTEIAQEIAAAPALDELFQRVVNLVQEKFGYYHAHVYTLAPLNKDHEMYLVMQEGTGQAGRIMKKAGHKIPLTAERSLVARVARQGKPVLVSDVSKEPGWLPNALLPETKSELAAPIKLGEKVLGVLDVQNNTVGTLSAEDQLLLMGLCGQIAVAIDYRRAEIERQHAEALLTRRAQVMAELYETSLEVNAQLDISMLLDAVVRRATELCGTERGGLFLLSSDDQFLELVASYNQPSDYHRRATLKIGEGLAGRIAQTGQPGMIENYRQWQGHASRYAAPIGRILAVPLKQEDWVIGVLNVFDSDAGSFSEEEIQLLSLFAAQATIAIQNARLHDEIQQHAEMLGEEVIERQQAETALAHRAVEMTALYQTALEINAELDTSILLQGIVRRAAGLTETQMGSLALVKPGENVLVVEAVHNRPASDLGVLIEFGQGIAGRIAQSGESMRIADYQNWPGHVADVAEGSAMGRVLGVPLKQGDQVVGTLCVLDEEAGEFSDNAVQLLNLFATYAAIVIQNVHLFEAEQRQREIAEAMSEVAKVVNSSLALDEVLDKALLELKDIVPFDAAHILLIEDETARLVTTRYYYGEKGLINKPLPLADLLLSAKTVSQKQPLLVPNSDKEPLWKPIVDSTTSSRCAIFAPFVIRDEVIAVLTIISFTPYRFSHEDVDVVSRFSQQVVIAIENANLYEQVQQYNVELEQRVTERTIELKAAQEELVHQEKLAVLGQLAGGVAHELLNPLGVVNNAVYFLQITLDNADKTTTEYLRIISDWVREAEKIVTGLIEFSHIRPAEREEIMVIDLIGGALELHPPPESVDVTIQIDPQIPPVFIDPKQIGQQVLGNLITNACHAMPDGGQLTLAAQVKQNYVGLSVTDTGSGMSAETVQKIFEPLFSTKTHGIGLGLAISKNLVEVNGGKIEVESKEGKGSTFTVSLPIMGVTP